MNRPNILFALADDASHFGIFGHSFVKTPNIDRVGREGIVFQNAFTTNPKCAPSRASILTGMHTWQNREACLHWNHWPENLGVFPDRMREAGYHIGFTGKGWAPGDFKRSGRKENPAGPRFAGKTLIPPKGSRISACDYAANFKDFLKHKGDGEPFYFWYGGHEPHRPYDFQEGRRHGKLLEEIATMPPYWPSEDLIKDDMLDYAFEIEWFDRQLGKMLDLLEARGELDNTLVIVTSDNGAPFPRVKGQMYEDDFHLPFVAMWKNKLAGGQVSQELISFVDLAPTFIEAAGLPAPTELSGVSLFDIFENREARHDRTEAYMGCERHDIGREGDLGYPVRCIRTAEYLYVRNFAPDRWPAGNPETGYTNCDSSPCKSRILELKEQGIDLYWRLAFGKRPMEELYRIKQDPHCLENLAGNDEYASVKEALWKRLEMKLRETDDPRILGNGDWFEQVAYVGNGSHSWANYVKGTWRPQQY